MYSKYFSINTFLIEQFDFEIEIFILGDTVESMEKITVVYFPAKEIWNELNK